MNAYSLAGSHHQPSVLFGTSDGIWNPADGKHDAAAPALSLGSVAAPCTSPARATTVRNNERAMSLSPAIVLGGVAVNWKAMVKVSPTETERTRCLNISNANRSSFSH